MKTKLELYKEYERRLLRNRLIVQGVDVEAHMERIEREYLSILTNTDIPKTLTVAKLKSYLS